jgi:hypothetical protein
MNTVYSIKSASTTGGVVLDQVWTQGESGGLAAGYTSLLPVQIGSNVTLLAYNKTTQKTDAYTLSAAAPWVQPATCQVNLAGGPWDSLNTFVLGNVNYLLTYRRDTGAFGFYQLADDLSVSPPYLFELSRNTPTKGFTTVGPYTSLGQLYVLGYNFDTGVVANFSVVVTSSSTGGVPPLLTLNVWYHQWAKAWTHFAFFQLGSANFFFKINTGKLNVNIDHIQDNPAMGTVEVGSHLQAQLPDALSIDIAATVPWADGEPYLLTYIAANGVTAIYRVHPDCLGWTKMNSGTTVKGASQSVPYRINDTSYALFYQG